MTDYRRYSVARSGWVVIVTLGLLVPIAQGPLALAQEEDTGEDTAMASPGFPLNASLALGEVRTLPGRRFTRVAIGNPEIADVTIVSPDEVMLQAKAVGTTNLLLWDGSGQHAVQVDVINQNSERIEPQLHRLLEDLSLTGVRVRREADKLFLAGQVPEQSGWDRLEQALAIYRGQIVNLVTVTPKPPVQPLPSVKLTVQLVEITRDSTDRLGVDWRKAYTISETPFTAADNDVANLGQRLNRGFRLGSLSRASTSGLSATLNMLISQGHARILAEPKLVAASGKEATTTLGVEVPVLTATNVSSGTVTQSIEFKQTGVELKFKPTVLADNRSVQLVIDTKVSSVDSSVAIVVQGISVPGFRIRHAQTEIVTASGEPVFIAGLLQDEERKSLGQLPAVGSIPILGNLFKSTEFITGKTELVVIVTPEVASLTTTEAAPAQAETAAPAATVGAAAPAPVAQPLAATQPESTKLPAEAQAAANPAQPAESLASQQTAPAAEPALPTASVTEEPTATPPQQVANQEEAQSTPTAQPQGEAQGPTPVDRELALATAVATVRTRDSIAQDPRFQYALEVQRRIAGALRYPAHEREAGISGTIQLTLQIVADGTLKQVTVTESSGVEALDEEALRAAKSQAPYPPFQPGITDTELSLQIPVIFRS